ncbi:hypothetical protein KA183_21295, partial [bacterium]|nr:hypothetical protein [bacterium]
SLLEKVLEKIGAVDFTEHIQFLRNLQDLRSSGSAHRKGDKYDKAAAKFSIEARSFRDTFREILKFSLDWLDYLLDLSKSGKLKH